MTANGQQSQHHAHDHVDFHAHNHQLHSSASSSSSSMTMAFGSWCDYKVTILFSSWTTSTPTEFAVAWILVMLSVIGYHALIAFEVPVKKRLHQVSGDWVQAMRRMKTHNQANENEPLTAVATDDLLGGRRHYTTGGTCAEKKRILEVTTRLWYKWRAFHALLSACKYGIALILMLIAMTYNILLFVALLVGYAVGDFIMQGIMVDDA